MEEHDATADLFRCLVQILGRTTMDEKKVRSIIGPAEKQLRAFNLCDGSNTQQDVCRAEKLDAGNFSRTVQRWVENGIVFKIGPSNKARLLHIYPLGAPNKSATPRVDARQRSSRGRS